MGLVERHPANPITGEISAETITVWDDEVYTGPRRGQHVTSTRFSTPYIVMFRPVVPILAAMRTDDTHVLMAVLDQIQPDTPTIRFDHTAAQQFTGLAPRTVANSLARLVAGGLLIRPQRGHLSLHPLYFWCHGAPSRETALTAWTARNLRRRPWPISLD